MALNTCETRSSDVKTAFFQKVMKNRPQTPVCDTFEFQYTSLLNTSPNFGHFHILTIGLKPPLQNEFVVTRQHQVTASDLPVYDIFAPQKNSSFELSDDVIVCDLWFGPSPIKNPGYACVSKSLSFLMFVNKCNFLQLSLKICNFFNFLVKQKLALLIIHVNSV